MNRKVHKNILGFSVLLLILSFFSLKSVYAETNSDACSSENLAKKYGSLDFDVQEKLVKIDASKLDAKYKNVKFNLYKVGNAEVSPSVVVTRSEAKDVDLSKYNVTGDSVDLFFTIENILTLLFWADIVSVLLNKLLFKSLLFIFSKFVGSKF